MNYEEENLKIIKEALEEAREELKTAEKIRKINKIKRRIAILEFALKLWEE